MPKIPVGNVEIFYDTHGDPSGVPLLLIMGLGAQMIVWDDEFVEMLVRHGHYVIRFDNRDVGESSHLNHLPAMPMLEAAMAVMSGQPVSAPYSLDDMAGDALGLLDALGIKAAHIVGVSMGGMISQILALRAPERVRSLTSIMSTTNDRSLPMGDPSAMQGLISLMSGSGVTSIEQAIAAYRSIASPAYELDVERVQRRFMQSVMRGFSPGGVARQFLAVLTTPGRGQTLSALRMPALVVHGEADPLVPPAAGRATAAAIPNARLWMIPGMGHDMPPALFEPIAKTIAEHAADAERAAVAAAF